VTEIHNHIMEGNVAKMRRVDSIPVPDGGSVTLQPGGYHIMLMDLKGPLKAGDTVKLKLKFEKAGEMEVDAKVQPIGASKSKAGMDAGAHMQKH
jgi:copper(I)-binding protein